MEFKNEDISDDSFVDEKNRPETVHPKNICSFIYEISGNL